LIEEMLGKLAEGFETIPFRRAKTLLDEMREADSSEEAQPAPRSPGSRFWGHLTWRSRPGLTMLPILAASGAQPPRPKFSYSGRLKRYRRGTAVFSLEVEEFCKSRNSYSDMLHVACLRAPSTPPSVSPPRPTECAIGDPPVQCVIDVPPQFVAST